MWTRDQLLVGLKVAATETQDFVECPACGKRASNWLTKYADTTALDTLTGQKVKAISFDSFLTLVLQQFKDKDTSDGLASAFRALADGKDALSASVLDKTLKPNEAAFLKEKLAPAEGGAADSYDYMPFSAAVYGAGSATPVS